MPTIHLVSHTHWDREWYLSFQQFRLKLVHLVDGLLDLLENEPDYKYFMLDGQAIILEDYLQVRPERKEALTRFVQNGRLLIGPWYISPDEFLLSPESHIRNLLEGQRICTAFGAKLQVGYLPDTFGHIGQMPQILQGFGIDTACIWRGLDDQPVELIWKSPDGSEVLLSYLRDSYSNAANLSINLADRFAHEIQDRSRSLAQFSSTGQVLLMNGTDHMEPSMDLPQALHEYQRVYPQDHLVHSNLILYFDSVRSQLNANHLEPPILVGELRSSKKTHLLPGVLSTQIGLKQRNSACEIDLLKWIEPLYAWVHDLVITPTVSINTKNHPVQPFLADQKLIIRHAWKLLMQCHPHDSICGTSIDQVISEMQVRFDQVAQISQALIDQNLHRLSDFINTRFPDNKGVGSPEQELLTSIVVFNPNDQPQTGLISCDVQLDGQYSSIQIIDDQNNLLPFDQNGIGPRELIATSMDRNGLKQALSMVHEGNVAGMVIRDFTIHNEENKAFIHVTISDHGVVDMAKWRAGLAKLDVLYADEQIDEFIITAHSDPEVSLAFIASHVPGHSYRTYWVRSLAPGNLPSQRVRKLNPVFQSLLPAIPLLARLPFVSQIVAGKKSRPRHLPPQIENEYFMVEFSKLDGTLSIMDKRTQKIYHGLNRFIDGGDCGDLYNYCPPQRDRFIHARMTSLMREDTHTSQKLRITMEMSLPGSLSLDRKSRSRQRLRHKLFTTITLLQGVPRLDIHTELENRSSDHRLRVHFPASFPCSTALYDGHFEIVERSIGVPPYDDTWVEQPRSEVPQRYFTLVSEDLVSLTIANRGLPEVEVLRDQAGNAEIALTLLRCTGWLSRDDMTTRKGHAGPMGISTPGAQVLGHHAFDYSIIPGGPDRLPSIHQAFSFNAPLKAISVPIHPGILPPEVSFMGNSNPNFVITAIKQAENNSDLVIRGYNIQPTPIDVALKPYSTYHHAYLTNLQEDIIDQVSISGDGHIDLNVGGNKIITVIFSN